MTHDVATFPRGFESGRDTYAAVCDACGATSLGNYPTPDAARFACEFNCEDMS